MIAQFFVGVDGGASKSIVRIEDEAGRVIGRVTSGPASIRFSVDKTWDTIQSAITTILSPLGMAIGDGSARFHAGMGLAGCELREAYQAFLQTPHLFETLVVTSDAHIACLGAHGGKDGAIIIIGTGAVGFQILQGETTKVGGWGFPHDDEGGGAWLGLEAIRLTLRWLDGRGQSSPLVKALYGHFAQDLPRLVRWANEANSTAFASLAPLIIEQAQAGDAMAIELMQQAALAITQIDRALLAAKQAPAYAEPPSQYAQRPCALVGGMAPFIGPYVGESLRAHLSPCQLSPDAGAVLLVRQHIAATR